MDEKQLCSANDILEILYIVTTVLQKYQFY